MFENGRHRVREFHREDLLRRSENEMFHIETAEGLHEVVLDGQVPAPRVPKAGSRPGKCSLPLSATAL